MGYEYDVFLSYLRQPPSGTWLNDHFLGYFTHQLGNALGRSAKIFVDVEEIHAGQKWPERLKQALGHSRCLVGVWNPLYFESEWCLCEFHVMLFRERKLGLGTATTPDGLIIGVKVNDGRFFLPAAKVSHYGNFEHFYADCPGFKASPLHVDFELAIVPFANDVARIVEGAPPWSVDFLSKEWMEDVITAVKVPASPKVPQPLINP
jgi:hypothetical protein